jgi:hypothetical protein
MQAILEEANSLAFSFPIPEQRIIWDLYPQDFFTKHLFINTAVTKAVPFLLLKSSSSASFLVQPAYTTPLVRISWVWPPIDTTH